ncbi:MAG: hypothetical protein LC745_05015 [Planctomycetia bacterium]|nr:hypothetical protein [Planctomycetia bacterium]
MSRLMFLLSLIAALSGTPLRQTEAAHDFAGSVAELGCGDVIEVADGGVGDDSGDTIRGDAFRAPVVPSVDDGRLAPTPPLLPGPATLCLSPTGRAHHPPPASAQRPGPPARSP